MSMRPGAWERLERYARWKQGRLRLDHLPDELVALVAASLRGEDLHNLVVALYLRAGECDRTTRGGGDEAANDDGCRRWWWGAWTARRVYRSVPPPVAMRWTQDASFRTIEHHAIHLMKDPALFFCSSPGVTCVALVADWSRFSLPKFPRSSSAPTTTSEKLHPVPHALCTYRWQATSGGGAAGVANLNYDACQAMLSGCLRRQACAVRTSLHVVWTNRSTPVFDVTCLKTDLMIVFPCSLFSTA